MVGGEVNVSETDGNIVMREWTETSLLTQPYTHHDDVFQLLSELLRPTFLQSCFSRWQEFLVFFFTWMAEHSVWWGGAVDWCCASGLPNTSHLAAWLVTTNHLISYSLLQPEPAPTYNRVSDCTLRVYIICVTITVYHKIPRFDLWYTFITSVCELKFNAIKLWIQNGENTRF